MTIDLQKFFIGLMDFFSILLPGALLTYLMMDQVGPAVLGERYSSLTGKNAGAEAWAVFLFASYLFGDWARRYTLNTQIALLARRGLLLSWLARALIWLVFKGERNLAVDRAAKIKQQALGALQAKDAINTSQWSKAWLNAESPASLAVVQRFEADSKFFRCFSVVLLILLATWPFQDKWPPAGIPVALVLLLLGLWRYMEQRFKSTNQAYWSVIILTAKDGKVVPDKSTGEVANPPSGGGVVFRLRGDTAEYLLVEAKNDPAQWVLPKGHVEEGEQHRETAVREVHEETGVWARIVDDLGNVSYTVYGNVVTTRFFLMQAVGRGLRKDKDRRHEWLPLQEAVAKASHIETRDLITKAQESEMTQELLSKAEQRRVRL